MIIRNKKTTTALYKGTKEIVKRYKGTLKVYEAWKNLTASGVLPLTLTKCKGVDLVDYKLYGNSIQNGTPTPETPVEVESVGDKTSNIADLSKVKVSSTTPNTKFTYDNTTGTLELTSTPRTFDYSTISASDLGLEVGKTYYYGGIIEVSGKQTTKNTYVVFSLNSYSHRQYNITEDGVIVVNETFTYTGQDSVNLRLFFNYSSSEPAKVTFRNVYVSEVKAEFEPYGYKIPVKISGKNLLPNEIYDMNNWKTITESTTNRKIYNLENLKEETIYTLSVNLSKKVGVGYLYLHESNDDFVTTNVTYFTVNPSDTLYPTHSFKTKRGYKYRLWYWNSNFNTFSELYSNFQLEQEPITTNIYLDEPLRKIGDYADYIDFKNQKVVRSFNKVDLGTLTWYTGLYTAGYYAKISQNAKRYSAIELPNSICDISKVQIWNGILDTYAFAHTTDMNEVYFKVASIYTLEQWQELTQGHYLIYQLDTEDDTETIELPNIPTFKGTTILSVDTTIQPSNVEVIYKGK